MRSKTLAAVLVTVVSAFAAAPCRASQPPPGTMPAAADEPPTAQTAATPSTTATPPTTATPGQVRLAVNVLTSPERPSGLMPLYVSLAALQVTDGVVTTWGVNHGRVESNPAFQPFANKPAALWAVKGAATVGAIYLSERLWRHAHRGEAIATMVVANGILVAVTARNASVVSRSR